MSVVNIPDAADCIPSAELVSLMTLSELAVPESEMEDWRVLVTAIDTAAKQVFEYDDYLPTVDYELYPRENIHEVNEGGWATKVTVTCRDPKSNLLNGRTIALKDNIALAGVRCTNGTAAMEWTPVIDATVATWLLDAGAIIKGKATCENGCMGAISDTSSTGPCHNPYAHGYSCGGSSSGSGRLVGTGEIDMSVGCDQGGSIRIPASFSGIVGLKPTWGLVPYTGIISLEATVDHAGPMTKDVRDCALMLDVMAGYDGIDDRVPKSLKPGSFNFLAGIESILELPRETSLKELKIGILREAFELHVQDPKVSNLVRSAAESLRAHGAEVEACSIPIHADPAIPSAWMCALAYAGTRQGMLSDMTGRKQLIMTDRIIQSGKRLTQDSFDALSPYGKGFYLRGLYLDHKYGPIVHARSRNLLRKLSDQYDAALKEYDILVMPTVPILPPTLTTEHMGPLKRVSRTLGSTTNTAPFNFSGHPAISVPVGFASPEEDSSVKLPVGMQLVGRHYEDLLVMQVAAIWENSHDWKTIYEKNNK